MTDLVSKPTPEVLLLQKELDKLRNELKQDRAIFEHHKYQAERRLNDEVGNWLWRLHSHNLVIHAD
jgi:hypothetical protein